MICDVCGKKTKVLFEGVYDEPTRFYCSDCCPPMYKKEYKGNILKEKEGLGAKGKIIYNRNSSKYGGISC